MVYPDNPLDETFTDKGNWNKQPKPINLNYVGNKGMPKGAIVYKPIKNRKTGKLIDLARQRLNERTRIMNYKAERIENQMFDYLSQNEVERKYQKQLEQITKLQAMFDDGVLGGLVTNIKNRATDEYRNDFLQNDPDVVNYDKETEEVLKDINELVELQEANDKKFHEISTQTQEAETQIIQKLRIAQKDEIEELGGLIDELENVKGEVELLKPLVEKDYFEDDEDGASSSDIRDIRAEERFLADKLDETNAKLMGIFNRVEGKAVQDQYNKLMSNITGIRIHLERGSNVKIDRRIKNIMRDAEEGKIKGYQTLYKQNQALEKQLDELEKANPVRLR